MAGRYLSEIVSKSKSEGTELEAVTITSLCEHKAQRKKVPGLGHPQHTGEDPRATRLIKIADELQLSGQHIKTLHILGQHAGKILDRPLPINVSGAIPACLLDAGWPLDALKAIPLIARAAGLSAHLFEETQRSIGFIMSHNADLAIEYDGKRSAKNESE